MTSTADPDYWSLLGLRADAGADQLKRAFRREARRWHPDLNGNDPVAEERARLIVDIDRRLAEVIPEAPYRREWLYHAQVPHLGMAYMDACMGPDIEQVKAAHEQLMTATDARIKAGIYWP